METKIYFVKFRLDWGRIWDSTNNLVCLSISQIKSFDLGSCHCLRVTIFSIFQAKLLEAICQTAWPSWQTLPTYSRTSPVFVSALRPSGNSSICFSIKYTPHCSTTLSIWSWNFLLFDTGWAAGPLRRPTTTVITEQRLWEHSSQSFW